MRMRINLIESLKEYLSISIQDELNNKETIINNCDTMRKFNDNINIYINKYVDIFKKLKEYVEETTIFLPQEIDKIKELHWYIIYKFNKIKKILPQEILELSFKLQINNIELPMIIEKEDNEEAKKEPEKEPNEEAKKEPEKEPEKEPNEEPEKEPNEEPEKEPNEEPEKEPNEEPEKEPNEEPEKEPNEEPEKEPNEEPEKEPNEEPEKEPNEEPEKEPNEEPEKEPNEEPEKEPNEEPEKEPNEEPEKEPNEEPDKKINEEPEKEQNKEPNKEPEKEPNEEADKKINEEPEKEPNEEYDLKNFKLDDETLVGCKYDPTKKTNIHHILHEGDIQLKSVLGGGGNKPIWEQGKYKVVKTLYTDDLFGSEDVIISNGKIYDSSGNATLIIDNANEEVGNV
jgi:hypothetical protein